jgi:hypothetical protein
MAPHNVPQSLNHGKDLRQVKITPQGGWIATYFEFHTSSIITGFSNRQYFVGFSKR